MKALTLDGKQTVRYASVPDPAIQAPGDVIVQTRLTSICGSDLHVYHGREKGLDPGSVMGHEFVGDVVETGGSVKLLKCGDRVASPFTTNCGSCFYCNEGLTSRCSQGQLFGWVQDGFGLQGVQAEYVRVPLADTTLLPLDPQVGLEEGLLLGDGLSTGYFCAEMAAVRPEGVYAVLGCGPVGLMAIVAARYLGAERIYCIDRIPERLLLGKSFGAVPVNLERENALGILQEATDGRGADAVLEAVGSPSAARFAIDLLRPGGTIASVGVHTKEQFSFAPTEAYDKNLTYRTGRCSARHYMERLLPLVLQDAFPLTSLISHRLPLSEGVKGYRIFDKKLDGCTKVVLTP